VGEEYLSETLKFFRIGLSQAHKTKLYQWSPAIVKAKKEDEKLTAEIKETITGVLMLIEKYAIGTFN